MGFDVQGKTALVTGANRGIGKAIVEALLAHGAAKVYAGVRSAAKAQPLLDAHGDRIEIIEIDLARPETIQAAAQAASDVELVVSNAGVLRTATILAGDAIEALNYEIEINVHGLIRMAQAFAPVLKKNGGGAFVQLNSIASLKAFPDFATYCASKAAAYSFTQSLKESLKEQGTAVLSVHPGPIASDMANDAGLSEIAEPPTLVGEGIVTALKAGRFPSLSRYDGQTNGRSIRSFRR